MNNTKIINEAEIAHVGQCVGSGNVAEKLVYGAAGGVSASKVRGAKGI